MWRKIVNITAAVVAGTVFVLGCVFVVGSTVHNRHESLFADPNETRTLTTTVEHEKDAGGTAHITKTVTKAPDAAGQTRMTTTVVTDTPGSLSEATTTTAPANDSLFARALTGAGFLFFRIALAALAAFLAGAVVQRTLLADFAVKVGPVEVPALAGAADASKSAIDALNQSLKKQTTSLGGRLGRLKSRVEQDAAATDAAAAAAERAVEALADLKRRVDTLEQRLP